ncbi:hypothetical protein EYC80_004746 [Monilinia laxa]|uniref:Uncharacterized protein n=1 Tax=Monilinia laxa TaxID=61186 RepID=A0A5N6KHQ8_MONLA|nr:hypothetical protein EYC80_004746 [Monilinia laxa]
MIYFSWYSRRDIEISKTHNTTIGRLRSIIGISFPNLLYRSRYVILMQFFHLDMNDFHGIGLFFLYLIVLSSVTFDLFSL